MIAYDIIVVLIAGAFISGFVNGFAGFGTALFAAGIWFAVLPAEIVPPLVVISAVIGQLTGLVRLRRHLAFDKARPLIIGGIVGVPIGTAALFVLAPDLIKALIGGFLMLYALWQLTGSKLRVSIPQQPPAKDRYVGFIGGVLGGIVGLSGPAPVIWLQLQPIPSSEQRARYQPFNLVILILSALSMALFGIITRDVLIYTLYSAPFSIIGANIGMALYARVSEANFRFWILMLLLLSGLSILAQFLSSP